MSYIIPRLLCSKTLKFFRFSSSLSSLKPNNDVNLCVHNRNPRNLERLRISPKPNGYFLDEPGHMFWNKLQLIVGARHITCQIVHNSGTVAVSASTKEWAINRFLYRTNDRSAYINLAKVFAQRCHEAGIIEFYVNVNREPGTKVLNFDFEII
uniref:39S ribosomal protein L18, mitochondrial n=1 Tax=Clastoptera arizonana TaxID=38151 RepID=A0A1B6DC41_9HEMI